MYKNFIYYKTSSPAGDLISFLAGIKQMWVQTGKRGVIYQRLNMVGVSYEAAVHPYENDDKLPIAFNQYAFDMMRPLLLSQEYIEDFIVYNGQPFEIDFDLIRLQHFTNQPKGSLNRWFNYSFPEMVSDLSKKWIHIPMGISNPYKDKVVVNFTQRHRNYTLTYFFLKQHENNIIFAGLPKERDLFCNEWGLDIPLLQVDNFYELAKTISGCKFFVGNQSFCFQLAEAMKIPRSLEIYPSLPNVIPVGELAMDYYHQSQSEFYFHKLLNR